MYTSVSLFRVALRISRHCSPERHWRLYGSGVFFGETGSGFLNIIWYQFGLKTCKKSRPATSEGLPVLHDSQIYLQKANNALRPYETVCSTKRSHIGGISQTVSGGRLVVTGDSRE
jgi:hypothetical protein